jgi:hypothetical protein
MRFFLWRFRLKTSKWVPMSEQLGTPEEKNGLIPKE